MSTVQKGQIGLSLLSNPSPTQLALGQLLLVLRYPWLREMIDIEGPLSYCSSALSLIAGVHIGARALIDINLIWFGNIA